MIDLEARKDHSDGSIKTDFLFVDTPIDDWNLICVVTLELIIMNLAPWCQGTRTLWHQGNYYLLCVIGNNLLPIFSIFHRIYKILHLD